MPPGFGKHGAAEGQRAEKVDYGNTLPIKHRIIDFCVQDIFLPIDFCVQDAIPSDLKVIIN